MNAIETFPVENKPLDEVLYRCRELVEISLPDRAALA
jgi:hypothetical protein